MASEKQKKEITVGRLPYTMSDHRVLLDAGMVSLKAALRDSIPQHTFYDRRDHTTLTGTILRSPDEGKDAEMVPMIRYEYNTLHASINMYIIKDAIPVTRRTGPLRFILGGRRRMNEEVNNAVFSARGLPEIEARTVSTEQS